MDQWARGMAVLGDVEESRRAGSYDVAREEQATQKIVEAGSLVYEAAGSLYETCGIHATHHQHDAENK
ncbi:hypothetical protein [Mycolicibacterium lutetiense]